MTQTIDTFNEEFDYGSARSDVRSFLKRYYPVFVEDFYKGYEEFLISGKPKERAKKYTPSQITLSSWKKWCGVRAVVSGAYKHLEMRDNAVLFIDDKNRYTLSERIILFIDSNTCSLCAFYFDKEYRIKEPQTDVNSPEYNKLHSCMGCPLYKELGNFPCDSPNIGNPYHSSMTNPNIMIKLLAKIYRAQLYEEIRNESRS